MLFFLLQGTHCEHYNDCFDYPCLGGVCRDLGDYYDCVCYSQYTGS